MTHAVPSLTQTYAQRFAPHLAAAEGFLNQLLPSQDPKVLWDAMRHGVLSGGKRIRAVMVLETCLACGGTQQQALGAAAALELIHCYSLIHDDLPCIDNDDLRRGKPTVHKAFGEDMAVLAGDALLAMAFFVLTDHTQDVPDKTLLNVVSHLSRSASVFGLVNGQVDDIQYANHPPSEALLKQIHQGKTGALFRFATWSGATLAGQPAPVADALSQFGQLLGVAFQIVDDLLDVNAEAATLGKTPGKDATQGKMTYPAVYGIEGSQKQLQQTLESLDAILNRLPADIDRDGLRFLVQFVKEREF